MSTALFGGKQAPPFQKGKAHPSHQKRRRKAIAVIRSGAKSPAEQRLEAARGAGAKSKAEVAMEKKRGVKPGRD